MTPTKPIASETNAAQPGGRLLGVFPVLDILLALSETKCSRIKMIAHRPPVSDQQQKVLQGNIEIRSVNDRDDDIDHRTNGMFRRNG